MIPTFILGLKFGLNPRSQTKQLRDELESLFMKYKNINGFWVVEGHGMTFRNIKR